MVTQRGNSKAVAATTSAAASMTVATVAVVVATGGRLEPQRAFEGETSKSRGSRSYREGWEDLKMRTNGLQHLEDFQGAAKPYGPWIPNTQGLKAVTLAASDCCFSSCQMPGLWPPKPRAITF